MTDRDAAVALQRGYAELNLHLRLMHCCSISVGFIQLLQLQDLSTPGHRSFYYPFLSCGGT